MMPDYKIESELGGTVVGMDEVGRGCLAGDIVVCAVWLDPDVIDGNLLSQINDSKLISRKKREVLYHALTNLPKSSLKYSIAHSSVEEIDDINILRATMLAMSRAYDKIDLTADAVIVDGNQLPSLPCKTFGFVKGDRKSLSIATASIIAKVYRDNLMSDLNVQYPQYLWHKNAGYGTKAHITAIEEFGITPHHRKSFKIREMKELA